jgi:hypothetical protein
MSAIDKLACSLGRRDEVPNQELANEIARNKDQKAVQEIIDNLKNKDKNIQSDCIKVVYEIGEIAPELIADFYKEFIDLLDHKNNRLQWGAMSALETITLLQPEVMHLNLAKLIDAAEKGTVITKDNLMAILVKLGSLPQYANDAFELLNEQLKKSLTNQLPMYAENAVPIINARNRDIFITTLQSRLGDIEKDTKRKRVEKVIATLMKQAANG